MNKKQKIFGAIVLGCCLAGAGIYAFLQWRDMRPTRENFDRILKAEWDAEQADPRRSGPGDVGSPRCIRPPIYPADVMSKNFRPFAGYVDFYSDIPPEPDREKRLQQLDALSKVGLLSKTPFTRDDNGNIRQGFRYSTSKAGWFASTYDTNNACFVYGKVGYLGVTDLSPIQGAHQIGVEAYALKFKIGFASHADQTPWAADAELQAAFPQIQKDVKEREVQTILAKVDGAWTSSNAVFRKRGMLAQTEGISFDGKTSHFFTSVDLPAPSMDAVKEILKAKHGDGKAESRDCLYMPGNDRLPVDKDLSDRNRYEVAIFTDKERKQYDRVVSKTIPYLNMLEQAGILEKRTGSIPGKGKERGRTFNAAIYQLTPSYQDKMESKDACFRLGERTVEIVDVQIGKDKRPEFPGHFFRYKLMVEYKNPPEWMTKPELKAAWPDLAGILDHGRACDGQFEFDTVKLQGGPGSGSCWLAFVSDYESDI